MLRVDTHQHFWKYNPDEYPWIKPDWPLCRDFLPKHLEPLLAQAGLDACIAVQARQTMEETRWLLQLATDHSFIAGVVGWVDLRSDALTDQLASLIMHPRFVGVRHVVQDEPDDWFMTRPEFLRGIAQLNEHQLAYDILIFPQQLPAAIELVRKFPEQTFILDHMAKPLIQDRRMEPWGERIRELAKAPNVACKISGLVTEASWRGWRREDFRPYLDLVWDAFGEDRLMIGSDWPVCLNSADYVATIQLAREFLGQFPEPVVCKVLGGNAIRWYRLKLKA